MTAEATADQDGIGKKIKRTFKRILWAVLLFVVVIMLFLYYGSFSEGTRSGIVIKMSKRGMVFKTWEGQLNMQSFGAMDPKGNSLNEVFSFSVAGGNDSLCAILEDVSLSGERVRLDYVERYATIPWRGETKYFVVGLQRSGKPVQIENQHSPVHH